MKLLVTRPLPGADATVARIEAAGHEAERMPLFALHPFAWDVPDATEYDALLLTSSNAVRLARAGLNRLADLPVYAVGSVTAQTAKIAGLNVVQSGTNGAQDMPPLAEAAGHRRLLWLAGKDRIPLPLPVGMTIDAVTVYSSDALPAPADFVQTVGAVDAVLLHSARAAAHFAALCDEQGCARGDVTIGTFSVAIAEKAGQGWCNVCVADRPSDEALIAALASCFTDKGDRP